MTMDEVRRANALRSYAILDTPPEPNFDRITALATSIFEHPVCTLALADSDRHWFKSRQGVAASEIPRHMSFCNQTIQGTDVFVVEDALADSRFVEAPFVAGAPHLRFYAGAPLITPSGARIGSLCVLDTEPQAFFSAKKRGILSDLASTVIEMLEARARQIELARCTEDIAHLARHDPLTGLPNRRWLVELAAEAIDGMRDGGEVALLYLDLDGFKRVNDHFGHHNGDALLRQVAGRLRATIPEGATVARLGGDEFVALITGRSGLRSTARGVGADLVDALASPFALEEALVTTGASVGIAVRPASLASIDGLLREADNALYAAKTAGRGRCVLAWDNEAAFAGAA